MHMYTIISVGRRSSDRIGTGRRTCTQRAQRHRTALTNKLGGDAGAGALEGESSPWWGPAWWGPDPAHTAHTAAQPASPKPDLPRVAPLLRQPREQPGRLLGPRPELRCKDGHQLLVHVCRHGAPVAAHVDVGAMLLHQVHDLGGRAVEEVLAGAGEAGRGQPVTQGARRHSADFPLKDERSARAAGLALGTHLHVVNVDAHAAPLPCRGAVRRVPREGRVQLGEGPLLLHGLQLPVKQKVPHAVLAPEEEPRLPHLGVRALLPEGPALLQESHERGHPGAGPDHDDWAGQGPGQAQLVARGTPAVEAHPGLHPAAAGDEVLPEAREVRRAKTLAAAAPPIRAHRGEGDQGEGNPERGGVLQGRGGHRVVALREGR
mmetsp:Transcript_4669/g.15473  ORF Transcript_4669/g.15473 Transcript_4669/m.15473 type:complete len:376 (-) Transcript_4669:71-1198(-)